MIMDLTVTWEERIGVSFVPEGVGILESPENCMYPVLNVAFILCPGYSFIIRKES